MIWIPAPSPLHRELAHRRAREDFQDDPRNFTDERPGDERARGHAGDARAVGDRVRGNRREASREYAPRRAGHLDDPTAGGTEPIDDRLRGRFRVVHADVASEEERRDTRQGRADEGDRDAVRDAEDVADQGGEEG